MLAVPDPTTFQLLPWRPHEKPAGRMFCDILNPDGTPYAGDSRHVLKRTLERAREKGYTFYVGPGLEYFYFQSDAAPGSGYQRNSVFNSRHRIQISKPCL